ncbi:MBL fold metallo-hydrolase [Glaciecola sp. XM2]|uniref:MBL fold metallo-hydrolase n=1 Tax=Glaciecola sp. XM2 TaxID=1914931 RepID=UPI001BDE7FF7|nr:MBL fold metallo-hydrolase [Glaciecola sp. XM2]MBT1450762.1 MBL fold metallo-hydrolase [Glaciecola sp. XM2]
MNIKTFHDPSTATFTYVVSDPKTKKCAVIDSVLDYDQYAGKATTQSADAVIDYIEKSGFSNEWILETHVHADHITAAHYLKTKIGGKIGIGEHIKDVLELWVPIFEIEKDVCLEGNQFDVLFSEGQTFNIGELEVSVWSTPGHTPACVSYLVQGHIFVGDTMFAPHLGTARCDFPGGSATMLYKTIQRLFTLPDETVVHLGHDYPAEGNDPTSSVTIGQAKQENVQIKPDTKLEEYVSKREARDATLAVPKLLLPGLQANLRNGQFGEVSAGGKQFIKIPVNVL